VLPEPAIPHVGAKIMDLQAPTAKMSKSADSPNGTLLVIDTPEEIQRKIRTAVTDSGRDIVFRPEEKPAISNLLAIYSMVAGMSIAELEAEYAGRGYAEFKQELADAVVAFLTPFRERHRTLMADPAEIDRLLEIGAQKAQSVAEKTLAAVYERVGFLPRRR